jgi:hypothetical protein
MVVKKAIVVKSEGKSKQNAETKEKEKKEILIWSYETKRKNNS